jgi:hypothetical protein
MEAEAEEEEAKRMPRPCGITKPPEWKRQHVLDGVLTSMCAMDENCHHLLSFNTLLEEYIPQIVNQVGPCVFEYFCFVLVTHTHVHMYTHAPTRTPTVRQAHDVAEQSQVLHQDFQRKSTS